MTSFLTFHAIAAACGDGLRPELLAALARDAAGSGAAGMDGMIQACPDPRAAGAVICPSGKSPDRFAAELLRTERLRRA